MRVECWKPRLIRIGQATPSAGFKTTQGLAGSIRGQPVSQVIRLAIAGHIEERKRDGGFQDSLSQRTERVQHMLPNDKN